VIFYNLVSSDIVKAIEPISVVEKEISYENSNNWSEIPSLWVASKKQELIDFFSNPENEKNKVGLYTIKKSQLVSWKEFPGDIAQSFSNINDYITQYGTAKVYYLAIDYQVHKQSQFFRNGINYLLAIVVQENEQWKIAEMSVAPVDIIVSRGIGFGTAHEKKRAEELR
jgi:hypothetical protein